MLPRARRLAPCCLLLAVGLSAAAQSPPPAPAPSPAQAPSPAPTDARAPQRIEREGVTLELRVDPATAGASALVEGRDAELRLTLRDAAGTPVAGLRPAMWIDSRVPNPAGPPPACADKVRAFLQGSLAARPTVDLNSYYILTLNREPNLSVIDPLVDFGGSRLLTLVGLDAPGEDWALQSDARRVYVSLPTLDRVAQVDTALWKVSARFEAGPRPTRVWLQPDQRALWVANDPEGTDAPSGGVSVLGLPGGASAARLRTGAGPHTLAFGRDARVAYVANAGAGSVSVIDTERLVKLRDVAVGKAPVSVAYSALSGAAYVADAADGSLTVIDGETHAVRARLALRPGIAQVRTSPDGRWGFVLDPGRKAVEVIDLSSDRVAHTLALEGEPDQVTFSSASAYFHARDSETMSLVALTALAGQTRPGVFKFPGGETAPQDAGPASPASLVWPTPEGDSVLVANPADEAIYHYKEGMSVPMGQYQNYRRVPRAVMVVDRSLRERDRGVYSARFTLPAAGAYDVALLLGAPRVTHCFDLLVERDPQARPDTRPRLRLELLSTELRAGAPARVRVRLRDAAQGTPRAGLSDVRLLALQPPGVWQQRAPAPPVAGEEGVYEADVTFAEPGLHFFFVEIPSLGLGFSHVPYVTGEVTAPADPGAGKEPR